LRVEGLPVDERGSAPERLTLAEALRQALRSSPDLQSALARVRLAEAEADQARLLPNPVLDLVLRSPSGGGHAEIDAGIAQDLLSVLTRPRRSRATDDRLARSAAEALAVALDLVAEVRLRYAAAQALEEELSLLRERRALVARLVEVARARLEQGEGSRLDATSIEAQALELDLEMQGRAANRRAERLALARLVGRPSADPEWALEPWSDVPEIPVSEADWVHRALAARPEIQAARWELAARLEEAGLAGAGVWEGLGTGADLELRDDESLGPALSLPIPIFDRGSERRARARAAILEARHELVTVQREAVEQVRLALVELETAQERLALVRDRLLPLALDRRRQVEVVYLGGAVDVTALLLAEQDLQEAQLRRVELEQDLANALTRLERATGGNAVREERPRGERDSNEESAETEE